MKLFELLNEGNIKHVTTKQNPDIAMSGAEELGHGFEARVYADKTGGTAIKVLDIDGDVEDSASYQYIDQIMSQPNNPFLPRIYNAKLYVRDGYERKKLVVQMERLTDFNSEKVAHLLPQLLAQLGIDENDIKGETQSYRNVQRMKSDTYHTPAAADQKEQRAQDMERRETLGALGDVLWDKFRTHEGRIKLIQATDNAQLKHALKVSHDVLKKHGSKKNADVVMKADLHDKNLMLRLTSHGPQLVITDPIVSFNKD